MKRGGLIALALVGALGGGAWISLASREHGATSASDVPRAEPTAARFAADSSPPSVPRVLTATRTSTGDEERAEVPDGPLDCGVPEVAVARVGDRVITSGALCDALRRTLGGAGVSESSVLQHAPKILARLVDDVLVEEALGQHRIEVTQTEISAELQRLTRGRELAPELADKGLELEDLEAEIRSSLGRKAFVEALGDVTVSEREVADEHASGRWSTPAEATVEGYLARVSPRLSDSDARALMTSAAETLAQGPYAPPVPVVTLPAFTLRASGLEPELEAFAASAPIGTWSPPLRTKAGWTVVRVTHTKPAEPRALSEVEADIRRALGMRKQKSEEQRLLAELHEDTSVTVRTRWTAR